MQAGCDALASTFTPADPLDSPNYVERRYTGTAQLVGRQVTVGSLDAVPNRVIGAQPYAYPTAGRRPDLPDERTVP